MAPCGADGDARSYTAISAGGAASEAGEGALSPLPGNRAPAAWKRGSGGAGGPSAPATPTTGGSDADFGHLAALEEKLQALNDTNASVMKQNVALTGELEAAHALARELRNEKAALAVQVRRLLEQQTRKSAAS